MSDVTIDSAIQSDFISDKDKLRLKTLEAGVLQSQVAYQNASSAMGSAHRALEAGVNELFKKLNVSVEKYAFDFQTMAFRVKD